MTDVRDAPVPTRTRSRAADAASEPWFDGGPARTAAEVLDLLRRYREAEAAMRARARSSMRMNETDLRALRHLLRAQRHDDLVRQRDLAEALDISSASVTALVDRLERSGHVERRPHPSDRRSVVLVPTDGTDREVRETLGDLHARMAAVAEDLTPEQLAAVGRFLSGMVDAVQSTSADERA